MTARRTDDQPRPVTLVTGASGGICGALAMLLAQAGHRLVLAGLDHPGLDAVAAEATACGAEVATIAGDMRDRDHALACTDLAVERFGRLDNLVTRAGASRPVPMVEMEDDEWDKFVDLNLSAVFRVSKAAARQMIEQGEGGAIVHISSIAHANGGANLAYGSAKGGVATLTYGMGQQLGRHGIRVNAVAPGIIDTPMVRNGFAAQFDALVEGAALRTPLGRLGKPEDVAAVIAFCSRPVRPSSPVR